MRTGYVASELGRPTLVKIFRTNDGEHIFREPVETVEKAYDRLTDWLTKPKDRSVH